MKNEQTISTNEPILKNGQELTQQEVDIATKGIFGNFGSAAYHTIKRAAESDDENGELWISNTHLEEGDPIWLAMNEYIDLHIKRCFHRPVRRKIRFIHMSPHSYIELSKMIVLMDHYERGQLTEPQKKEVDYRIGGAGWFSGPAQIEDRKRYFVRRLANSLRSLRRLEAKARAAGIEVEFAYGESAFPFVYWEGYGGVVGVYRLSCSSELGDAYRMEEDNSFFKSILASFEEWLALGQRIEEVSSDWETKALGKVSQHIQPAKDYVDGKPRLNTYPAGYTNY